MASATRMAGEEPREIVLTQAAAASGPSGCSAEHMLDFESLKAVPDQLVTYFFWAEDIGPDGQPRRTSGDMFFAEVRHFEEIFRQGEQPPSGSAENEEQEGEGNAQEADQLAELQKEIINGTWKLIRRETRPKPTDKFAEDAKVLRESQHAAIEQAAQLGGRLRDAASKASLEQATQLMKEAEKHLGRGRREVVDRPAHGRPWSPSRRPTRRCSSCVRASSRSSAATRGSAGEAAGARAAARRSGSSSSSSSRTTKTATKSSARPAREQNSTQREREQRENAAGPQPPPRAGPAADRPERTAQGAAIGPRSGQDRAGPRRRSSGSSSGSASSSSRSSATPTSSASGWRREENRDRMAEARQQIEQGREHVRQASEALEEGRLSAGPHRGTPGRPATERPPRGAPQEGRRIDSPRK